MLPVQVYRGVIKGVGGGEVAIKVQRPDVLPSVALDLYLMRAFAVLVQRLPAVRLSHGVPCSRVIELLRSVQHPEITGCPECAHWKSASAALRMNMQAAALGMCFYRMGFSNCRCGLTGRA